MNAYDAIAPLYALDMGASMPFDDVAHYRAIAERVGGPVLELGCGTGRVLGSLLNAGFDGVGVDQSEPMLALARRDWPRAQWLQADLRALKLTRRFGLVLMPYALATYLLDERDWRALRAGLAPALTAGAQVVVDSFLPRPVPTGRWLRDYARWVAMDGAPSAWLVRHKRLTDDADSSRTIERRYRLRGFNGGRTLVTRERLKPHPLGALRERVSTHIGAIVATVFDYGHSKDASEARFVTLEAQWRP
jgi:SAM-dependent methyltransferase